MNKNFKFIALVLSFMFCFSAIAFGQGTSGSIEGYVSDSQGARIPNATVKVESTGSTTGFNRTVTADGQGYVNIQSVPPGTYKVTVSAPNFTTTTADVNVVIDKASNLGTVLQVAGSDPNIVNVVADSAVNIDPTDTKIDTNITKQIINDLPKGTQFTSLLKIAPNVRPEALSGGFQIDGASGSENVFVIDGQEVTNFRTGVLNTNNNLPFELLQEVQIKSTGFEAEYGGATGGVINVVTIGGNDSWRGNFGVGFEPQKLQGSPNTILNRFSTNTSGNFEQFEPFKTGGLSFFPTAALSGPVIKEKLWFSAIYAPQIFDFTQDVPFYTAGVINPIFGLPEASNNPNTRFVGQTQRLTFKRKIEEAFFRLDAQPTQKLRMFGTFLWNPIIDEGATVGGTYGLSNYPKAGPFFSQGGTFQDQNQFLGNQGGRQNSNSINGQVTYTPTNNLVFNVRAGRNFLNEKLGSYGIPEETRFNCNSSGNPNYILPYHPVTNPTANPLETGSQSRAGCTAAFANFPTNFQINYDVSTRTTFDADASLVGINLGGRHNFKFGYQYNGLFNTVDDGYRNTGQTILFYGLTMNSLVGGLSSSPLCTSTVTPAPGCIYGVGYLQRFATLGEASSSSNSIFAQDSWQIGNRFTLNIGIRAEKETVPSFSDQGQAVEFNWGDKLAPRLGVAFDLTGDGKTKVFASYGWFYDRFKYELPRGSFGGDFFRRDYFEITPGRGAAFTNYTYNNILGGRPDVFGGDCPIIGGPGYSICQFDFRIPTNLIGGSIFESGGVDPDLKAARQSEYTIGVERELMRNVLFSARYTHKQLDEAIEDVGVFNAAGSEAYIIGNPGRGLVCEISTDGGRPCDLAERKYDAFEARVDLRRAKYFFNASYTWSRLFGNYSGLASSDEAGRTSPNVSRLFDLPFASYTATGEPNNGLLATDRPHVFKAYGGYSFDWNDNKTNVTTVSAFTTLQSGTPLTSIISLYSLSPFILNRRGDLGRTEMFSETDLSVSHRYKFGRDNRFSLEPYINFRNLFDERNVLGVQATYTATNFSASTLRLGGCPASLCATSADSSGAQENAVINAIILGGGIRQYIDNYLALPTTSVAGRVRNDYGQPNSFQTPREVRFGARFFF